MIIPGDKTEIKLTVKIDNRVASALNLGPRDMSGTLILHTIPGKDHFIAISGEYREFGRVVFFFSLTFTAFLLGFFHSHTQVPSCFANKLTTLIRLPGPIRSLNSSNDLRSEDHPLNAPREIMRLVNWLMGSSNLPKDLFLIVPDENMVGTIREVC